MRIKRLTLNNIGSFAGEHSFLFQTAAVNLDKY